MSVNVDANRFLPEATAFCTASRADSPWRAAAKVEATCKALRKLGRSRCFKKIDSTFKGNVGAEVAAAVSALSAEVALICPTLPEQGRMVKGGQLFVNQEDGVRLSAILAEQTQLPIRCCSVSELLDLQLPPRPELWVIDAASQQDLRVIGQRAALWGGAALPVGSSGLLRMLVIDEGPQQHAKPERRPLLVCVLGSQNPATARQLHALESSPSVRSWGDHREELRLPGRSAASDPRGRGVLIFRMSWTVDADRRLRDLLNQMDDADGTLLVGGGDTAQEVCRRLGCRTIEIRGEVEPGVPFGRMSDGMLAGWQMITKAGGFGNDRTLVQIRDAVFRET